MNEREKFVCPRCAHRTVISGRTKRRRVEVRTDGETFRGTESLERCGACRTVVRVILAEEAA